tara:strand:- start:132 stop:392 length:261 start_codon:yes stop_codon:yes gene_type:complete
MTIRSGMEAKALRGKVSYLIQTMDSIGEPATSGIIRDRYNGKFKQGMSMNELTQTLVRYSRYFRKVAPATRRKRECTWALEAWFDE